MPSYVVLPSFNERANIIDLLDAVEAQGAPVVAKVQIVVVDDNSPDRVADLVRQRVQARLA